MNDSFLKNLVNYTPGQYVVSKDLEVIKKEEVTKSSYWRKLVYLVKGTFNAKKTAVAIDKYLTEMLENDRFNPRGPSAQQLPKILENLKHLNSRFSDKGITVLTKTIQKVEKSIKKIQEKQAPIKQSATPPPIPSNVASAIKDTQPSPKNSPKQQPKSEIKPSGEAKTTLPPPTKTSIENLSQVQTQKLSSKVENTSTISPDQSNNKMTKTSRKKKKIKASISTQTASLSKVQNSDPPSTLDLLKTVQDQINTLNPESSNLSQKAREIRTSLQQIVLENPELKYLFPLIEIMSILETKGAYAFKLSFLNETLLQKFNIPYIYDKESLQPPLEALIDFLKMPQQESSLISIGHHLLSKSSQVKTKWLQLQNEYFARQINLDNTSLLKKDLMETRQLLAGMRQQLSEDYQQILEQVKGKYASEDFQKLLSHYPNSDLAVNQELILDSLMNSLTDQIINAFDSFSSLSVRQKSDAREKLYEEMRRQLDAIIENGLNRYDWLKRNQSNILVPYDQGADFHRNQGLGTCLQNSSRRHQQLLSNSHVATEQIEMPSNLKERIIKAKISLGSKYGERSELGAIVKEYGFDDKAMTSRSYILKSGSHQEYMNLVRELTAPLEKGKSLLGLWTMTDKTPEGKEVSGHVFNIQIDPFDPEKKIFRILDDNIGAVRFSSLKELREELASYLDIFYYNFNNFRLLIN